MESQTSVRILWICNCAAFGESQPDPFMNLQFHKSTSPFGEEAVKAAESAKPHLIIIETAKGEFEVGLQTCRMLKTAFHGRAANILLIAGKLGLRDKLAAFESGVREYLVKPLGPGVLADKVAQLIGNNGAGRAFLMQGNPMKDPLEEKNRKLAAAQRRIDKLRFQVRDLEKSLLETNRRLHAVSARMIADEEAGCNRLARELHDCVGQNMTALKINLNLVLEKLSPECRSAVGKRVKESIQLTSETTQRIREIMTALRCQILDYDGLLEALQWEANSFSERTGIKVSLVGEPILPRPSPEVETALFRIAQESLTNVFKHAKAKKVSIELQNKHNCIHLNIRDEGIGFDPATTSPTPKGGWGLIHMKERIESESGRLQIISIKGKGTSIIAEIPKKSASSPEAVS